MPLNNIYCIVIIMLTGMILYKLSCQPKKYNLIDSNSFQNYKPINSIGLSNTILPEHREQLSNHRPFIEYTPEIINLPRRPSIPHFYPSEMYNDILYPLSSIDTYIDH